MRVCDICDCRCNCIHGEQFGSDFCTDGECWLCTGCSCDCTRDTEDRDYYLEEMERIEK